MDIAVLFARIPVSDFKVAQGCYEHFLARAPDAVAHDNEVMWQVTGGGWLYIVRDADRAGRTTVAMAVSDIKRVTAGLEARGVRTGPIQEEGLEGRGARSRWQLDRDHRSSRCEMNEFGLVPTFSVHSRKGGADRR
jgi:hypothetical protein